MKTTRFLLCAFAAATMILTGCNSNDDGESPIDLPVDIYVAGDYGINDKRIACYWINGIRTDLAVPAGVGDSHGYSIAVSGTDIYVAGRYRDNIDWVPCYWKNGVHTPLSTLGNAGDYDATACSVTVAGGSVYMAGQTYDGNNLVACVWKDGVRTDLIVPTGTRSSYSTSIAVAGTDIYVTGNYSDGSNWVPCLWKNNSIAEVLALPAGMTEADGYSVVATDGDVYVAGYSMDDTYTGVPCYWKNSVYTPLSVIANTVGWTGHAKSVVVADGSVYMTGNTYDGSKYVACMWKDGVRTDFAVPATGSTVGNSIAVACGMVFVAGEYNIDVESSEAYLWIDGVRTTLSMPKGTPDSVARSVVVVER